MKTMKFLAVLALLSFSMNTMAQNALQKKIKENKAALKEKASKAARRQAKEYQKEGWKVFPGDLPLEKQCDRMYFYLEDVDDDLINNYIDGTGIAPAENLAAAQAHATELARMDLAGKVGSDVTGIVDNMIGNKVLAGDQAASITTMLEESKSLFSQQLGRVQVPLKLWREKKGSNTKEVLIRMVAKTSTIQEITKEAIRKELTKDGKELSEELKAFFDKD